MLIVCPSCATSYMIDPGSVGPAGRMVRCARCKTAWFTGGPKQEVSGFVDDVIAEAEARETGHPMPARRSPAPPPPPPPAPQMAPPMPEPADDFGAEPSMPVGAPQIEPELPPLPESLVPMTEAPPLVPAEPEALPAPNSDDIESFDARRERMHVKRKEKRRSSKWTALVLILFAINVALIGARQEVVHYLPQTASLFSAIGLPVNLRQLAFDNVRVSKEEHDGMAVLVVEGTIVSTSKKPVEVPKLRFAVRNTTGQEIYSWTAQATKSILEPGETLPFRSRLASPPPDSNDGMVRFFSARDAEPGKK